MLPLASAYVHTGEVDRAERVLEEMFKFGSISPEPRLLLAQIFELRQQGERALDESDRVLELNPSSP